MSSLRSYKNTFLLAFSFLLLLAAVISAQTTSGKAPDPNTKPAPLAAFSTGPASSQMQIFLPLIMSPPKPFQPEADTELEGGTYTYESIVIPDGVTVTVTGDAVINVLGTVNISGTLTADCFAIDLHGQDDIRVTGVIDNQCGGSRSAPPGQTAGDLTIQTDGGNMVLGLPDSPVTILSSGNITITNDPGIEFWELILPPELRSDIPLPPVCTATVNHLLDFTAPDVPARMRFYGWGIDPDGGPVTYAWDFGDGDSAGGESPRHAYSAAGVYDVVLTVTDDDAQTCTSSLRVAVEEDSNAPEAPAAQLSMSTILAEVGEDFYFDALAVDLQGDDLSYHLDFGDSTFTTAITSTHSYQAVGRYEATLTVTDTNGLSSAATASVYVHPLIQSPARVAAPEVSSNDVCTSPEANGYENIIGGRFEAGDGADGTEYLDGGDGKRLLLYQAFKEDKLEQVVILPGTFLSSGDGGESPGDTDQILAVARSGGDGGELALRFPYGTDQKPNVICGNVTFKAGDGGDGGDASAGLTDLNVGRRTDAIGGDGGSPGGIVLSLHKADFAGSNVVVDLGSGGGGGDATARSHSGQDGCPEGEGGGEARAYAGDGGDVPGLVTEISDFGLYSEPGDVQLEGRAGGDGGIADAVGRKGGDADCSPGGLASGGAGGDAKAIGGDGGSGGGLPKGAQDFVVGSGALQSGDSGAAVAEGGDGGFASAVSTGGMTCLGRIATGGAGGEATASAWRGKTGRGGNGASGAARAKGGDGGYAEATGDTCTGCGVEGGRAEATGGKGGNAVTRELGFPLTDDPVTQIMIGGRGGDAEAQGGDGGDCDECPGGAGGDGGDAEATGGKGGDAVVLAGLDESDELTGGNGGDADALGGNGGHGADCCKEPGGDGGNGGWATAIAGAGGEPNGNPGTNGGRGGHGGDGGDGDPPGSGGIPGLGRGEPDDIPDGQAGEDGAICAARDNWYIYHGDIPQGDITPGTDYYLPTYSEPNLNTQTGEVPIHFMTADETLGYDIGVYPPWYNKNNSELFVRGGIEYILIYLQDFQTIVITITLNHTAVTTGQIRAVGLYNDQEIVTVWNTQTGTPSSPAQEDFVLTKPDEAPHFDGFRLLTPETVVRLDDWPVVLLDP